VKESNGMVVFVLVLIWLVVILPIAVRKFSEYQLVSSVARFRHRTELLERAHANFVGLNARLSVPPAKARVLNDAQVTLERAVRARIDARRTRRRETLLLLGSGICSTLLIGAVPSLRGFWVVAVLLATITGVYLTLLIRCAATEALAAERARNIIGITIAAEAELQQECRIVATGGGRNSFVPQTPERHRPCLVIPNRPA
jgi:hypothetical protein